MYITLPFLGQPAFFLKNPNHYTGEMRKTSGSWYNELTAREELSNEYFKYKPNYNIMKS